MPNILLAEDETAIADTVLYALRADGFEATHCLTGRDALQAARGRVSAVEPFDLAILDIGLPDVDGFALCRELRREGDLPVSFLIARDAEMDRVLGLELGADDYVVKPFSPRELVARVRAVLRRTQAMGIVDVGMMEVGTTEVLVKTEFEHDSAGKRIRYRSQLLDLTRYEYGLLAALLSRPGAVLSRAQLMDRVWDEALDSSDRTVDTQVKTLRAKLRSVAPVADSIQTHRGLGYSLDA